MASILIIEDELMLSKAYTFLLQSQGHTVACATNGKEGLEKLLNFKPDIILLDMMMPVLDGKGFLHRYKPAKHPETKVILLSNMQSHEYADEAMALGAYRYELKSSLAPDQLLKLVEESLSK